MTYSFSSEELLKQRIVRLETKLTPEQAAVSFIKAEKLAYEFIQKEALSSGWRSWIPGMFKKNDPSPAASPS